MRFRKREKEEIQDDAVISPYLLEEEEQKPKRKGLANKDENLPSQEEIEEAILQEEEELDRLAELDKKAENLLKTSILKDFLNEEKSPNITDISFNGTNLYIQDNKKGRYKVIQPEDTPESQKFNSLNIASLMTSIANVKGQQFTEAEPIMDTEMDGYRINAVHKHASPYGTTMAIRISRARLAITPENESILAPEPILIFLKLLMETNENLLISGITGSGKTELQKYLVGAIPDLHKISLMEDTMDSHIKELYPDKDINSWRTLTQESRLKKVGFPELIKAGLRNNPDRLMISEIRGGLEAYDLLVATLTGHSVLTTLHAYSAMHIPSRLRSMIGQEYSLDPEILGDDIVNHLPYGVHMEMVVLESGEIIRRIREVVEYTQYRNNRVEYNIIFQRQTKYVNKQYVEQDIINTLTHNTIQKFKDKRVYHKVPPVLIPIDKNNQNTKNNNNKNNNKQKAKA